MPRTALHARRVQRYRRLLRNRNLALLLGGATISEIGDAGTLVALVWLVYEPTGSSTLVSQLVVAYTAPVAVGGLLAAALLDRLPVRTLLVADNAVRGVAVALVPVASLLGALTTAHVFVVAAIYGLLRMTSLAGIPTLLAASADDDLYDTANALEQTGFALGGIAGPAAAGAVVSVFPAEVFLALDAASYLTFVVCLLGMRVSAAPTQPARSGRSSFRPALRLAWRNIPIRTTTLMFVAANVGEGMLIVLLPVYAVEVLQESAGTYGALAAALTVGLLAGTLAVGAMRWRRDLGRSIAVAQTLAGIPLAFLALQLSLPAAVAVIALAGVLMAPLTVWAQSLRMRLVPPELRGRFFALLRTTMQLGPPIGAAVGGVALAAAGTSGTALAAAAAITLPGIAGGLVLARLPTPAELAQET